MKKAICILLLCANFLRGVTRDELWASLTQVVNESASLTITLNVNKDEVNSLTEKVNSLTKTLNDTQDAIDSANEAAQELENAQALLEEESNVIDRGVLGSVTNDTELDYVIDWPDGTSTNVSAQSTVTVNQLFSDFKQGSLTGGIISFVPQVAGADISENDAQSQSYGVSYSLLFNVQGLNQPGYNYGAVNKIAISRSYPTGATRSQGLDLNSLVDEDEIWAIDVILNQVSTLGSFYYPRFSTLYKNRYDESDNTTLPDPSSQTNWETQKAIDQSLTDVTISYPAFTDDTSKYWGDIIDVSLDSVVGDSTQYINTVVNG